jgi:hypothetical protein
MPTVLIRKCRKEELGYLKEKRKEKEKMGNIMCKKETSLPRQTSTHLVCCRQRWAAFSSLSLSLVARHNLNRVLSTPLGADLRELAVGQRLREDAVVDESESVPLGGTFGLKVPEDPTSVC